MERELATSVNGDDDNHKTLRRNLVVASVERQIVNRQERGWVANANDDLQTRWRPLWPRPQQKRSWRLMACSATPHVHTIELLLRRSRSLVNMAGQAKAAMGVDTLDALVDGGYFSGEEVRPACEVI
jgi:hypothetical protein